MATVVFQIRVDSALVQELRSAAARSGITQTSIIDQALRAWLGLDSGRTLPDRVDRLEQRVDALEGV